MITMEESTKTRAVALVHDFEGDSHQALCFTCAEGNRQVAAYLIQHLGADVNCRVGFNGGTPLHVAVFFGYVDVTRLLVREFGADVAVVGSLGETALHIAAERGHADVVRVLVTELEACIEARTAQGYTPLHLAFRKNDTEVVRTLVALGADMGATEGFGGGSLIHIAVIFGCREMVRMLVNEFGVDVNTRADENGRTPLHVAANLDFLEMARLLVRLGADVEAKACDGTTPFFVAIAQYNSLDIARFLVEEAGADVAATSRDGQTPLHMATTFGNNQEAVLALVTEFAAPVDAHDFKGNTPLHLAAMDGYRQRSIVEILANCGAHLGLRNNDGWTPLHCAANGGHDQIVRLLSRSDMGKRVANDADNKGRTPLHLAVSGGSLLSFLCACGGVWRRCEREGCSWHYSLPPRRGTRFG